MSQANPPGTAGRDTARQDLLRYVLGKAQAPTPKRGLCSMSSAAASGEKGPLKKAPATDTADPLNTLRPARRPKSPRKGCRLSWGSGAKGRITFNDNSIFTIAQQKPFRKSRSSGLRKTSSDLLGVAVLTQEIVIKLLFLLEESAAVLPVFLRPARKPPTCSRKKASDLSRGNLLRPV